MKLAMYVNNIMHPFVKECSHSSHTVLALFTLQCFVCWLFSKSRQQASGICHSLFPDLQSAVPNLIFTTNSLCSYVLWSQGQSNVCTNISFSLPRTMPTLWSVWLTLTSVLAQSSVRPFTTALAVSQSSRYAHF